MGSAPYRCMYLKMSFYIYKRQQVSSVMLRVTLLSTEKTKLTGLSENHLTFVQSTISTLTYLIKKEFQPLKAMKGPDNWVWVGRGDRELVMGVENN